MIKLKWIVAPAPTGRYRYFERRSWPHAEYADGSIAGSIYCADDYRPANVKTGNHSELTVRVADYSVTPWKWREVQKTYATLAEAKAALVRVLDKHPEIQKVQP